MRKCHYVNEPGLGKVLIPGCWPVTISNDMETCNCRNERPEPENESQFQRQMYNDRVAKLKAVIEDQKEYIQELEKAYARLNRIVGKLSSRKDFTLEP